MWTRRHNISPPGKVQNNANRESNRSAKGIFSAFPFRVSFSEYSFLMFEEIKLIKILKNCDLFLYPCIDLDCEWYLMVAFEMIMKIRLLCKLCCYLTR